MVVNLTKVDNCFVHRTRSLPTLFSNYRTSAVHAAGPRDLVEYSKHVRVYSIASKQLCVVSQKKTTAPTDCCRMPQHKTRCHTAPVLERKGSSVAVAVSHFSEVILLFSEASCCVKALHFWFTIDGNRLVPSAIIMFCSFSPVSEL